MVDVGRDRGTVCGVDLPWEHPSSLSATALFYDTVSNEAKDGVSLLLAQSLN